MTPKTAPLFNLSQADIDEALGLAAPAAVSAEQAALREALVRLSGFDGQAGVRGKGVWQRLCEPLAAEFDAGRMPASRQAAFLWALLDPRHGWIEKNAAALAPAIALGARIAAQSEPPFSWAGAFPIYIANPKDPETRRSLHLGIEEAASKSDFSPVAFTAGPLLHSLFRESAARFRARLVELGDLPLSALGRDPRRLLLVASGPADLAVRDFPAAPPPLLFEAEMSRLGLFDAQPPAPAIKQASPGSSASPGSESESAASRPDEPMLRTLLRNALEHSNVDDCEGWLSLLARRARQPWLRGDVRASGWDGEHPLVLLARFACEFGAVDSLPESIEAIMDLGFGPDWSTPSGSKALASDDLSPLPPNALWSFVARAERLFDSHKAIEALLRGGADVHAREPGENGREGRTLLRYVNERAALTTQTLLAPSIRSNWEQIFQMIVAAGVDPIEALPRSCAQDACKGRIREMVAGSLERRELLAAANEVDPAELAEALALVRERRALSGAANNPSDQEKAQPAQPGSVAGKASAGRRL
jgi:hypothetical protein